MIAHLLEERAKDAADEVFLVSDSDTYTFSRCWDLARKLSSILAECVQPGEHVALIAGNSAAYIIALLGINFVGGVAVCLNNSLLGDSILYQIQQSDSRLLIMDREWEIRSGEEIRNEIAALPKIVIEDESSFFAHVDMASSRSPYIRASYEPCTILYTSGTTGLPKGVICPEASYLAGGGAMAELLELNRSDRTMVFMPLFHINPQIYALMPALHTGSALVIRSRFSAQRFFDDARRFAITGFTFVGSILAILATRYAGVIRDHGLRFCVGGGTDIALATDIETRFGFRVHELYGMTEIGGWVSGSKASQKRIGTNGQPRQDIELRIADEGDNEVAPGTQGEILIRTKQPNLIFAGYYEKPEEYVKTIRNLWFHTGDIGSIDTENYLTFHGRRGDVIRRGGEMISPDMIEKVLLKFPGVEDCAVVGVPDSIMGMEVKAVIVSAGLVTVSVLLDHLSQFFPRYMLPRYIEFVTSIPRTETAKIRRNELKGIGGEVLDVSQLAGGAADGTS